MSQSDPLIEQVRSSIGLAGDPAGHRIVCAMSGGVKSAMVNGLPSGPMT